VTTDAAPQPAVPQPPAPRRFFSDQLMMELGQALLEEQLVTRDQLTELTSRQALSGETLDQMLVKEALVREQDILGILSKLTNIPLRHIGEFKIERPAVDKVQPRVALRYQIMPLCFDGVVLTLAVNRVPALTTADSLRVLLDAPLDWVLCTENDISKTIKYFYGLGADTVAAIAETKPVVSEVEIEGSRDVSLDSADEGIIRFVNQIISEAIRMEATDIHVEPFEDELRLRYRIDGMLQNIPVPQGVRRLSKAISSCVKIMANMNIAERRRPHDGRIRVRSGNDDFDLRVSVLPSAHGETVNMRLLNRATMFIDLEHLGLAGNQMPAIKHISSLPHGVVLLTGPTGSGKTTTLYATLSRINSDEVKIITVEDPIEYQMRGISQIQVHSEIGLTFANILRSILRHDPDIILIGEIRDQETADIAVRASLTGHLVFSTLHTNDAPGAITRLDDMGIEPFLVSSCLEGVIAQRLVRRVCNECREEAAPDDTILEEIAQHYPDRIKDAVFHIGHGCPDCNFTGYRGRMGLFEIMLMNDELRSLVVHRRPANEIKKTALENGLVTLRRDGWRRVLEGVTTVDEVVRVARRDDIAEGR